MGVADDPVNNTAGAAESLENHTPGPTENPINDSSSENPVKDKAPAAENPANDVFDGTVNIISHQAACAKNPESDRADFTETPASEQAVCAENLVNAQVGGAENPANEQAVGNAENPANNQLDGGVINIVNYKAGGAENPASEQVGSAENLVNNQAEGAENPVSEQAGSAENLLNNLAGCGAKDHLNDQEAGGAENSVNNKAGTAENPVNDEVGASDVAMNDKTGGVEIVNNNSSSKEIDATEGLVNDEQGPAESLVEDEAHAVETPVSSKADCLPEEAKEILRSLASKWEDVLDANALQVIPLKGAMTNQVFQIKWPTTMGETSRKVLVRIYGEGVDIFFDRGHEIRTFEFMSKNGQGPRLLGRFANGRVEEFIHARTLSASDLRNPPISALIAAKMKEFHDLGMPGEKKVHLWDTLRNWLSEAKCLSSPQEVEAFYLDTIDKEISILEKELSGAHQQIGFCHNDLQYGNIMLDEETNSVTIIDYEYANYNPVAYDIANHFCEMAANYHTEEPHILDYNKYPDFEERQRFVKAYLSTTGEQPSDSEVEQLLQEIEKYTLANHLFWGIWGIISAQVNTIDFDYKEYAKQRFQEYWARKPYLLISSEAPSPYNVPEGTGELASALPTKSSKNSGIFRKMKRVLSLGLFKSKS